MLHLSREILKVGLILWLGIGRNAGAIETVTLPLQTIFLTEEEGGPEYKLGIPVSLGGGAFKLYEFDTGASGFYAAYNPDWWPRHATFHEEFKPVKYSSGIEYFGAIATTLIDFGHGIPPIKTNVGKINRATGNLVPHWNSDVRNDRPPLYYHFYGDFGIALGTHSGLFGILPQLPGNLSSGFIVSTGGIRSPDARVLIGLTDELRKQFSYFTPMQPVGGTGLFPCPVEGGIARLNYQEQLIKGTLTLRSGSPRLSAITPIVLDTGAPSTEIHNISNSFKIPDSMISVDQDHLVDGTLLDLIAGGSSGTAPWRLSYAAGDETGYTYAGYTTTEVSKGGSYINTGLNAFFRFDVMFDVEKGRVGFRQIGTGRASLNVFGDNRRSTSQSSITIRGAAHGGSQLVSRVEYKNGYHEAYTSAQGVSHWEATIRLERGTNTLLFRAVDAAGRSSTTRKIIVVRE